MSSENHPLPSLCDRQCVWQLSQCIIGPYDQQILPPLMWQVYRGQRWAVVAPSGTGKSLLLNTLIGLLAPTNGVLTVAGQAMGTTEDRHWHAFREQLGVVFQQDALFDWLTARQNILLKINEQGLPLDQFDVVDAASKLGLSAEDLNKRPAQLSGGMARRVALLRAVAHQPAVLVLDEPAAGLDPATLGLFISFIADYTEKRNATLVFSTHETAVVLGLATHVLALIPNELAWQGTCEAFASTPHFARWNGASGLGLG